MAEEKTEQPSELKLRQARQKGQVAKSADVAAWTSIACAFFSLTLLLGWFYKKIHALFLEVTTLAFNGPFLDEKILHHAFDTWFLLSLPVLFVAGLGGMIGNLAQFGFLMTAHPLKPDIKRLDPIKGIKKIFSKDKFFEFIKQLVKFFIVSSVIVISIKESLRDLSLLSRVKLDTQIIVLGGIVFSIFFRVIICFLMVALIDWFWQKMSFIKSMKMTKYEVKKEYKQQEGDPQLKHERKRIHQEFVDSNGGHGVEDASVVITNPSHLAIALCYREEHDQAPKVIAKGSGRDAQLLKRKAERAQVPIIRNVSLARDLMWLEVNEEIPEHLYDAVAEVLTFIYELNRKQSEGDI